MKKVVVTGATGCLGISLCKMLLATNHQIIALGRNKKIGRYLSVLGINFIAIDLKEAKRLKLLCQEAEVIYHCAALSSAWGDYQAFYEANVLGTKNIAEQI